MNKKVLILIAIAVIFIAAAAYYFLFGGQELVVQMMNGNTAQDADSQTNAQNRPDEAVPLLLLSKRAAISPILSLTGGTVWYFEETGQLYRAKLDGSEDVSYGLSDVEPVSKALWPAVGNDFIVKTSREGSVPFRYYNSQSASFVDLPGNIVELAWLPDGKRIVYVWRKSDGKYELQTADPDAKNFTKLADLSGLHSLKVPLSGDFVLLGENPAAGAANKVFKFDLAVKTLTPFLDRGRNLDLSISPDGAKILFTRVDETAGLPELWLADINANTFQNLRLVTSISKTVWSRSSDKFYYALPESVASSDVGVTGNTGDTLHIYDIASASGTKLEPKGLTAMDLRDLILADNEQTLVFRNGVNERLYRVSLK